MKGTVDYEWETTFVHDCQHTNRWYRCLLLSKYKGEVCYPTKDQVQDSFIKGLHLHTFVIVTEPNICVSCEVNATLSL